MVHSIKKTISITLQHISIFLWKKSLANFKFREEEFFRPKKGRETWNCDVVLGVA